MACIQEVYDNEHHTEQSWNIKVHRIHCILLNVALKRISTPMEHFGNFIEYPIDMDSLVFTYPRRSWVNETGTCTFAQKNLLDEQNQRDGQLFSQFYNAVIGETLGTRWRTCLQTIFHIKMLQTNNILSHGKVSWWAWSQSLTCWGTVIWVLHIIFKSIFLHHCIKTKKSYAIIQNNSIMLL